MKTDETCYRHATLSWQQAVNEPDDSWPSRDAHMLLNATAETRLTADQSTRSLIIEWLNKPHQANPCVRTMNDLPEVRCTQYLGYSFSLIHCLLV